MASNKITSQKEGIWSNKGVVRYHVRLSWSEPDCVRKLFHERYDVIQRGFKTPCWIFNVDINAKGYGQMTIDNKKIRAHRISWMLHNGSIPKGIFICHQCDNRPCVNPDHLFMGTNNDNMKDAAIKGRFPKRVGEINPSAKLTRDDVLFIRSNPHGMTGRALAKRFSMSPSAISCIILRKSWPHI